MGTHVLDKDLGHARASRQDLIWQVGNALLNRPAVRTEPPINAPRLIDLLFDVVSTSMCWYAGKLVEQVSGPVSSRQASVPEAPLRARVFVCRARASWSVGQVRRVAKEARRQAITRLEVVAQKNTYSAGPDCGQHGHQLLHDGFFNGDPHPGNMCPSAQPSIPEQQNLLSRVADFLRASRPRRLPCCWLGCVPDDPDDVPAAHPRACGWGQLAARRRARGAD